MYKNILLLLILLICFAIPAKAQFDPEVNGWNFYNFLMTEDSTELWNIYHRAFLGVAANRSLANPEDILFFDKILWRYACHASCFGMSLLANICYVEGGHLGVCSPVSLCEGDLSGTHAGPDVNVVRNSIGIMHIRQLTQPMISSLIDIFNDNNWTDAQYAYNQVDLLLATTSNLPVLSFMPASIESIESATGGTQEAHTVVPYKTQDTGTHYRIYVYDPNFPYSTNSDFYEGAAIKNYIEIDKSGWNHYWKYPTTFNPADPNSYGWEGSNSGPWTIIISPTANAKYKDNHPLNVSYLLGEIGALIFSSGSGGSGVEQITDNEGKSFYSYSGGKKAFEKNPSNKTNNILRWPFFNGTKRLGDELYFIKDISGNSLDIEIAGTSQKYSCEFLHKDNLVSLSVAGGVKGKDKISLKSIATRKQIVEISSERAMSNVKIDLTRKLEDNQTMRTFTISDLNIQKNAPVQMQLSNDLQSIELISDKAEISYNLQLSQRLKGEVRKSVVEKIKTPAGKIQELRLQNWEQLDKEKIDKQLKLKK